MTWLETMPLIPYGEGMPYVHRLAGIRGYCLELEEEMNSWTITLPAINGNPIIAPMLSSTHPHIICDLEHPLGYSYALQWLASQMLGEVTDPALRIFTDTNGSNIRWSISGMKVPPTLGMEIEDLDIPHTLPRLEALAAGCALIVKEGPAPIPQLSRIEVLMDG